MTRIIYADARTVIEVDTATGTVHAWHENSCRRPGSARVDNPADLAAFARWHLPSSLSRIDFDALVKAKLSADAA